MCFEILLTETPDAARLKIGRVKIVTDGDTEEPILRRGLLAAPPFSHFREIRADPAGAAGLVERGRGAGRSVINSRWLAGRQKTFGFRETRIPYRTDWGISANFTNAT